jgi:hypothetical protein
VESTTPDVVGERGAGPGGVGNSVLEELTGVAEAFVVAGLVGQRREPRLRMGVWAWRMERASDVKSNKAHSTARVTSSVRKPGSDSHSWSFGSLFGAIEQRVVDCRMLCGGEGVQLGVHAKVLQN